MKIQKHVKIGGGLGGLSLLGFFCWVTFSSWAWEKSRGRTDDSYIYWLITLEDVLLTILSVLLFTSLAVGAGMLAFWLGGHILRFIKHQWSLASERQTHKRLLKAKELHASGIYSDEEFQAKLREIKSA